MQNNNGFVSVGIIVAIIAVLVIGGVAYYVGKKSKNISEINPITQVPQNTNIKYEDTPESKVEFETDFMYLINFEKRSDGYWYFNLFNLNYPNYDEFDFDDLKDNTKTKIFRISPSLKIVTESSDCNYNNPEGFETYLLKLKKKNGYYWNPTHPDLVSYRFNESYSIEVNNGRVTKMIETSCISSED
jgi:hypothetical protein